MSVITRLVNLANAALLLSALGLTAACGCSQSAVESAVAASPAAIEKKPAAGLTDLDGRVVDLRSTAEGKVHVAVFIRSDCPISNRMAPEVRELYQEFKPKDVDFYLIYVDPRETAEAIRDHLRDYEYPCSPLRDVNHVFAEETQATVTPEAVVFNDEWKVVYRGRINDMYEDFGKSRETPSRRDLRDAIVATLADKPVAEPVTKAIGCYISDLK
jgi:cytochrome oxidase Cu insertion factor (SCO1/SenC/PrrC family)